MAEKRERLAAFMILGALASAVYFGTQHVWFYAASAMRATFLDQLVPFNPAFIVPYFSFFLLILMPLLVIRPGEQVRQVAFGFGFIVVVSGVAFLFWPTTAGVRDDSMLRILLAFDTERNACPSLHASLSMYCALCSQRAIGSRWLRAGLWVWTILAVTSALVTKQHVALDIVAGAALGVAVYFALFRAVQAEPADSLPVLETIRIRNSLSQQSDAAFAALARHNLAKRVAEFGVFVPLAAGGFALSAWARSIGSTPLWIAGVLATAIALNSFPLLMHEGMHGTLFANRKWNWIISVLLGASFLMSFSSYRILHIRHHRYLGDPRDPDDYHNYSRNRAMVWFLHFVRLTFGPFLYVFLIPVLALKYGSLGRRKRICIEYAILFTIYSAILRMYPARELFFVWFLPLLLMGLFTAIRGFTQHGITDASDPYLASRTMLPNPVVAFFLLNENYHLEHHLFPEIPSYHLHGLHQLIWPKLPRAVSGRSYLAFLGKFLKATPRMDESPIGLVNPSESAQ